MRADRLISLIMLLESRGSMTAQALAMELEVSVRTIYRDMQALCIAGIPFESEAGTGGGYRLEKGYRSNLHGLKTEELQALTTLKLPAYVLPPPLAQSLKSALLKVQAGASTQRPQLSSSMARCFIDASNWFEADWKNPLLEEAYLSVSDRVEVLLHYRAPELGGMVFNRIVRPYALFLYVDDWIFLYAVGTKTQGRSCRDILSIEKTEKLFTLPEPEQIEALYEEWKKNYRKPSSQYIVKVKTAGVWRKHLPEFLSKEWVPQMPLPMKDKEQNWVEMDLTFENLEEARKKLLIIGGMVKVLEPLALKLALQDFASEILKLYKD